MIFPILRGFVGFRSAPVTWVLVMLTSSIFVISQTSLQSSEDSLNKLMRDSFFIRTQGRIYARYLENREQRKEASTFIKTLADAVSHGELDRAELLGQLAFRDSAFMNAFRTLELPQDRVAERLWRNRVQAVLQLQEIHPSYALGLDTSDQSVSRWVSYIFVHGSWFHVLGNMFFLMIFGTALERQIKGLALLVVYILSGVFAAGIFSLFTGVTSSPLVGASGAISGIMALYCFKNWGRPERFFYWFFLPIRGFMGFVFLPAWVALFVWAVHDMAGYMGSIPELGGVAYSAHLGGEIAGIFIGVILAVMRRQWPATNSSMSGHKMFELYPLLLPHRKVS